MELSRLCWPVGMSARDCPGCGLIKAEVWVLSHVRQEKLAESKQTGVRMLSTVDAM